MSNVFLTRPWVISALYRIAACSGPSTRSSCNTGFSFCWNMLLAVSLVLPVDWLQFCIVDSELAEKLPSPETYILLGDAYMSIQEVCLCSPSVPTEFTVNFILLLHSQQLSDTLAYVYVCCGYHCHAKHILINTRSAELLLVLVNEIYTILPRSF